MELAGLVFDMIAIFGAPLLVLILIILCIGKLLNDEKTKKITLFIFSLIYKCCSWPYGFLITFLVNFFIRCKDGICSLHICNHINSNKYI